MKRLLEFYLAYFDLLYSDPDYRITDSETTTNPGNASLTISGSVLTWRVSSDRGQAQIVVAASRFATSGNWFWISLLKQYLDKQQDIDYLPAIAEIEWARSNMDRIVQLFSEPTTVEATCDELRALRRANAQKQLG